METENRASNEIVLKNPKNIVEYYVKVFRTFSFVILSTVFTLMIVFEGFTRWIIFLTSWGYMLEMVLFCLLTLESWKIINGEKYFVKIALARLFSFTIVCTLNISLFFFFICFPLVIIKKQAGNALGFIGICIEHLFPFLLIYLDFINNNFDMYDILTLVLNNIFLAIYFTVSFILFFCFNISGYDFLNFKSWTIYLVVFFGFVLDVLAFFLIKYNSDCKESLGSIFIGVFAKINKSIIKICKKSHRDDLLHEGDNEIV